ncbi:MAG: hypothetical protein KAH32_01230 [Chlamydiia bacterium]|nr:hypothetical protein [Chlamydiia bacterium]
MAEKDVFMVDSILIKEKDISGNFSDISPSQDLQDIYGSLSSRYGCLDDLMLEKDITLLKKRFSSNVDYYTDYKDSSLTAVFVVDKSSLLNDVIVKSPNTKVCEISNNLASQYKGKYKNRSNISSLCKEIIKSLSEYGYYNVSVYYEVSLVGDNSFDLTINIDTNNMLIIDNVKFSGDVTQQEYNEFKGILSINKKRWLLSLIDSNKTGTFNVSEAVNNVNVIKKYYKDIGFCDVSVKVITNKEKQEVEYIVRKGDLYKIKDLRVSGNEAILDPEITRLCASFSGESLPYSSEMVSRISEIISNYYKMRGKIDVNIDVIIKSIENSSVLLELVVYEGDSFTVGDINIVGNTKTSIDLILHDLDLIVGAPINLRNIDISIGRMKSRGLFKDVSYYLTPSAIEGVKDINIVINEMKSLKIVGGVELLHDCYPTIKASFMNLPNVGNAVKYLFGSFGHDRFKGDGVSADLSATIKSVVPWRNYSVDLNIANSLIRGSNFSVFTGLTKGRSGMNAFYSENINKIYAGTSWISSFYPGALRLMGSIDLSHVNIEMDRLERENLNYRIKDKSNIFKDQSISATVSASAGIISLDTKANYCLGNYKNINIFSSISIGSSFDIMKDILTLRFRATAKSLMYYDSLNRKDTDINDDIPINQHIIIGPLPATLIFRGLSHSRTLFNSDPKVNKYVLPQSAAVMSIELVGMPNEILSPMIFVDFIASSRDKMFRSFIDNKFVTDNYNSSFMISAGFVLEIKVQSNPFQIGFCKVWSPIHPNDASDTVFSVSGMFG